MQNITLLDTSIGSTNRGDEIIMQCVEEELHELIQNCFILRIPTHVAAFNMLECIGQLPDTARAVSQSKYKFVCGTNLLQGNMLHRTNQWDISLFNSKPLMNSVLIGVGSSSFSVENYYTRCLYKKVLSHNIVHSVRDKKAYNLVKSLGLKCIYTGCVTMWKLKSGFCDSIPSEKHDSVVFTLTDYKKDSEKDNFMIEVLKRNYRKLYFWIQGENDLDYLRNITNMSDISIIPSSLNNFSEVLSYSGNDAVDYVGTRLHAGIYAMRHQVRSIIIRVDDRMDEMSCCIPNNTISRLNIGQLEEIIRSSIYTKCVLDWDGINEWKKQFDL